MTLCLLFLFLGGALEVEAVDMLVRDLENQMKIVDKKIAEDDLFENCYKINNGEFICNFLASIKEKAV